MVIVFFCLCLYPPDTPTGDYVRLGQTKNRFQRTRYIIERNWKLEPRRISDYLRLPDGPLLSGNPDVSEPFKLRHFLAIKRRISLFKYKLRQGFAKNYRAKQLRRLRIQSIHTNAWAILSKFRICRKYRATVLNYEYI